MDTALALHTPKPGRRKATVTLYLNPELIRQVDILARDTLATRSAIVTQALLALLEAQGGF